MHGTCILVCKARKNESKHWNNDQIMCYPLLQPEYAWIQYVLDVFDWVKRHRRQDVDQYRRLVDLDQNNYLYFCVCFCFSGGKYYKDQHEIWLIFATNWSFLLLAVSTLFQAAGSLYYDLESRCKGQCDDVTWSVVTCECVAGKEIALSRFSAQGVIKQRVGRLYSDGATWPVTYHELQ